MNHRTFCIVFSSLLQVNMNVSYKYIVICVYDWLSAGTGVLWYKFLLFGLVLSFVLLTLLLLTNKSQKPSAIFMPKVH